jgi:hypothetical protein
MSWSVTFQGTADTIADAFTREIERFRRNNPPVGELEDIQFAQTFVVDMSAERNCQLSGSAAGHWSSVDNRPVFESLSLALNRYVPPQPDLAAATPEDVAADQPLRPGPDVTAADLLADALDDQQPTTTAEPLDNDAPAPTDSAT